MVSSQKSLAIFAVCSLFLTALDESVCSSASAQDIPTLTAEIRRCLGTVTVEERDGKAAIVGVAFPNAMTLFTHRQPTDARMLAVVKVGTLEELSLRNTQVTTAGLREMSALPLLKILDLRGTLVDDGGMQHLQQLTNLRTLYLDGTKVSDEGLEALWPLVALRSLGLADTDVTDDGLHDIAKLRCLQNLDLSRTKVSAKGVEHLRGLTLLRRLDLSRTSCSDEVWPVLAKCVGLNEVYLDYNAVHGKGLEAIWALPLKDLWLNGTQVTDATLGSLTSVKSLVLHGVPGKHFEGLIQR